MRRHLLVVSEKKIKMLKIKMLNFKFKLVKFNLFRKILNIQMSLMQCKNSKIQNAINNIFFDMLYPNMD